MCTCAWLAPRLASHVPSRSARRGVRGSGRSPLGGAGWWVCSPACAARGFATARILCSYGAKRMLRMYCVLISTSVGRRGRMSYQRKTRAQLHSSSSIQSDWHSHTAPCTKYCKRHSQRKGKRNIIATCWCSFLNGSQRTQRLVILVVLAWRAVAVRTLVRCLHPLVLCGSQLRCLYAQNFFRVPARVGQQTRRLWDQRRKRRLSLWLSRRLWRHLRGCDGDELRGPGRARAPWPERPAPWCLRTTRTSWVPVNR